MSTEAERIATLEAQVKSLLEDLQEERADMKLLKDQFAKTQKKIDATETWGRAVIWVILAISGFMSQFSAIAAWFKKI